MPSKVSRGGECPAKDFLGLLILGGSRCPCQHSRKMIIFVENILKVTKIIWINMLEKCVGIKVMSDVFILEADYTYL